ncbi:hypothetical protein B0H14DRAFT_3509281 [Mycena olivaceomarginata]|nr:hypothetical protein B0H14DRAFT_3509281 [Mycena olivaceomarginata]
MPPATRRAARTTALLKFYIRNHKGRLRRSGPSASKASGPIFREQSLKGFRQCLICGNRKLEETRHTQKMYAGLSRPQCSVLTQLRTGHIGLNAYLHRFKLAPSPLCPHCLTPPESVPHFLLFCPAHRSHRLRLIARIGSARLSLRSLLASKVDAAPVLAFVRDTGRLPNYVL